SGGPAMAATKIVLGSSLRPLIWSTRVWTGISWPCSSAGTQAPAGMEKAIVREGGAPLQRGPYSLQRYGHSGPSAPLTYWEVALERWESGGAEQSSSLVMRMIAR